MTRRFVLVSLLLSVILSADEPSSVVPQQVPVAGLIPFENALAQMAEHSKIAADYLSFYRKQHRLGVIDGASIIPLEDGSPGAFYVVVIPEAYQFRDAVPFICEPFPAFGLVQSSNTGPVVHAAALLRGLVYMGDCLRVMVNDTPPETWVDAELNTNEMVAHMLDEVTSGGWTRMAGRSATIRDAMLETRGQDVDRFVFGPIDGDDEKLHTLFGPLSDADTAMLGVALAFHANLLRAARAAERHAREGQDLEAIRAERARDCMKEFREHAKRTQTP